MILTLNYFDWKPKILLLLCSKGFYMITMGTETEPTSTIEKLKYFNRMDEAYEIICLSFSSDLLFYVVSC